MINKTLKQFDITKIAQLIDLWPQLRQSA